MKIMRRAAIALVLIVLSSPLIHGQDLSKYRTFSLGMTLADVSKQVDATPADVVTVHEHPALIQELTWWPLPSYGSSLPVEPVTRILFSFDNGALYRMLVTYDESAIKGLTADDLIQAISAKYGPATRPAAVVNFPTNPSYEPSEKVLARWEDPQYSLNLFQLPSQDTFAILMFSKSMDAQAVISMAESVKMERQAAPQKVAAQMKKDADDQEDERQKNIKAFHP